MQGIICHKNGILGGLNLEHSCGQLVHILVSMTVALPFYVIVIM